MSTMYRTFAASAEHCWMVYGGYFAPPQLDRPHPSLPSKTLLGDRRWPNPSAFHEYRKKDVWGDRLYGWVNFDQFLINKPEFDYEWNPLTKEVKYPKMDAPMRVVDQYPKLATPVPKEWVGADDFKLPERGL